ncbi:hypothetical protein MCG98_14175 [Ruminococcus sp. OA3]|uniref:hypothetical protein n=1 Tax=Ruminococcus sp. OA3 TaxID=2914164 RepID=UPI001F0670F3|nr:hypothetical protein [Ruminococcus sp. OA3]MCH1983717.1 hypothetical protein [Ruminococcus sp. OA3]
MVTNREIYDANLCRECLNKKYSLKLKKKDCLYYYYSQQCSGCGDLHHIVAKVRFGKRWKLL